VSDYACIRATDVAKRSVEVIYALKRDGSDVPARQSRAVHLKTNFQLDKQAVRY
jgi:hypothetical protein